MTFSIRKTIPILCVTPVVVAIGLIGSFSFFYGRRSVNQLSEKLMQSTTNYVQEQVTGLLEEALLLNRLNAKPKDHYNHGQSNCPYTILALYHASAYSIQNSDNRDRLRCGGEHQKSDQK